MPDKYNKMDTEEPLTLLKALRADGIQISGGEANETLYQMITVGFDIENGELLSQWLAACHAYLDGAEEFPFPDCSARDLLEMETCYKKLDLYYQMCHRFFLPCEEERVTAEKVRLAGEIDDAIARDLQNYRHRCRICGRTLPWNAPFGICDACFAGGAGDRPGEPRQRGGAAKRPPGGPPARPPRPQQKARAGSQGSSRTKTGGKSRGSGNRPQNRPQSKPQEKPVMAS